VNEVGAPKRVVSAPSRSNPVNQNAQIVCGHLSDRRNRKSNGRPRGGERRRPSACGASPRGVDRRLQRAVAGEVRGLGGDRDRGIVRPIRPERAPAAGAGASEVKRVPQRRLVFVAAGARNAGGRGLQARRRRKAPAEGGVSRTIA
jgi:hypothetical protein